VRLADFIHDRMEAILAQWQDFAAELPNARGMSLEDLRDHAQQILEAVAKDLSVPQTRAARVDKGKGRAPRPAHARETAAQTHALMRARGGFDINEMTAEYRALRASVVGMWVDAGDRQPTDFEDVIRFNEAIDQAICESVAFFSADNERARNLLLGILGHDMRTPLNAIQLTAHHLNALNAGSDVTVAAGILINSGARLRALLDDLTDFNRKRLGLGLYIIPCDSDLKDILTDQIQQLRRAYPGRTIELDLRGDLRGRWDEGRLHQLVTNLVGNALRYGTPGSTVRVTANGSDDAILFSVENQGPKISQAVLSSLFDPLRRGPERPPEEGSLGLGLFICGEVAKAHGGEISATSSESGTFFNVRLPRTLPT
jgi:signal transduction histidine kinase